MARKITPTSATLVHRICRHYNIPYGKGHDNSSGRFSHLQLLKLWAIISTQEDTNEPSETQESISV